MRGGFGNGSNLFESPSQQQQMDDDSPQYHTHHVNLADTETINLDEAGPEGDKGHPGPTSGEHVDLVQEILTNRDLLISKGFYFFFYAAFGSLFPLMGVYFKQLGLNSVQAGILTGIRPFIEFLSAPFWNSLADRFQRGKLLLMASLLSWIVFTSALAYIRPPASACITFNGTHHILYKAYSNENDEDFREAVTHERKPKRSPSLIDSHQPVASYSVLFPLGEDAVEIKSKEEWEESDGHDSKATIEKREAGHNPPPPPPPNHIIGKSPITIDYTLNYKKDTHTSYVSPPFSTIVYKWADIESVFFLLWLLIILGEFFSSPAITLADSVTLEHLDDNIDNYNRQRMFGSVGWAISMFFVGMVLDNSTEFSNHPCGPHESERNYKVCFSIFAVLMIFAAAVASQFRFAYQPSSEGFQESQHNLPMKPFTTGPKPIFNTAPPINPPPGMAREKKFEFLDKWKSAVFAQRTRELPEWMEVLKAFANLRYGAFLLVTWFMGAGIGLVFTFLFWHLQDLGGTPTLFGMASVINHISEILAYFYSLEFIKKHGHTKVLCFGLACNIGRFLYISWLDNPWWVLPLEFIQGVTHAAVWAACCSYITQATPPHLKSSTQGVLQGLHHGLGRGSGALLGGIFINKFGSRVTFAAYGLLSIIMLAFFVFVNYRRTEIGFRWFEDEIEHQVYLEEGGSLAPHGVPSAPIARTASKTNLTNTGQTHSELSNSSDRFFSSNQATSLNPNQWDTSQPDYSSHWNADRGGYSSSPLALLEDEPGKGLISDNTSPDAPIQDYDRIREDFRNLSAVISVNTENSAKEDTSTFDLLLQKAKPKTNTFNPQPQNYSQTYEW